MVASGALSPSPPLLSPDPLARRLGYGLVRFTLTDALSMMEQGILPEDSSVELLDGALVHRDRFDRRGSEIVEGTGHNFVLAALGALSNRINTDARHIRTQSTLVCADTHAPIPDAVILRGTLTDYRGKLPSAADAFCVIEVADSSYERDAGPKLEGYARAGVTQYVIINLRNRTAEVYSNPDSVNGRYSEPLIIPANQTVLFRVGATDTLSIPLQELLP